MIFGMKCLLPFVLLLPCITPFLLTQEFTAAEPNDARVRDQYEGNLGENRVGITIIHEGIEIDGGHYFYRKYLKDIPLTGTVDASNVTLREPNGTFHLHFVGNGSERGEHLNFENSIGMAGNWTSANGRRNYPVSLKGQFEVADNGRWYAQVTNDSDAAFENRVQTCFRAIIAGDKTTTVRLISYPLTANLPSGKSKIFKNSEQVLSAWTNIFTPGLIAKLRKDLPHDMFVHNGMAMLGDGEAWFDRKGLAALNVPPTRAKSASSSEFQ
jgi:hypothetical protein